MAKQNKQTESDYNMITIDTAEAEGHIDASIQAKSDLFLFGRRGSGKTEIAKQRIAERGYKEVYINLSVKERVDLGGYPNMFDQKGDYISFKKPDFYKQLIKASEETEQLHHLRSQMDEIESAEIQLVHKQIPKEETKAFFDKKEALQSEIDALVKKIEEIKKTEPEAVVIFDEADKADPSIYAPLLEFVQFKTIDGMKLDNMRSCILTGNLIAEGGSRPSLPLLDRAEKYIVTADANRWLEWAGRKPGTIHPSILAFIQDNADALFGEVDPEDRYADASPRGWFGASHLAYSAEEFNWDVHNEDPNRLSSKLAQKVAGRVGKQAGMKFIMYYNYYSKYVPLINKLLGGTLSTEKLEAVDKSVITKGIKEINQKENYVQNIVSMIVATRLSYYFDKEHDLKNDKEYGPKSAKYKLAKHNLETVLNNSFHIFSNIEQENFYVAARTQITVKRIMQHDLMERPGWKEKFDELVSRMKETSVK
jgi:hypothetical protein